VGDRLVLEDADGDGVGAGVSRCVGGGSDVHAVEANGTAHGGVAADSARPHGNPG
jgi:hypothetical protein